MLSDSCFDFVSDVRTLATRFAEDVDHYSAEPFIYPPEMIERLRTACAAVAASDEHLAALVALASEIMRELDRPPAQSS